ncbi:MAG: DUF885 family protein [Planctomycetota bacterium]|nr:DUF885 family protein [Planctomycetota bacterium]
MKTPLLSITCLLILGLPAVHAQTDHAAVRAELLGPATMPELCAQYSADRGALERLYRYPFSAQRQARQAQLGADWLAKLDAVDFEGLGRSAQVDWLLLRGEVAHDLEALADQVVKEAEVRHLVTFAKPLVELLEARSARVLPGDEGAREAAEVLFAASAAMDELRDAWKAAEDRRGDHADDGHTADLDTGLGEHAEGPRPRAAEREAGDHGAGAADPMPTISASAARRTAGAVGQLRSALSSWYRFGAEYDPLFTWWCEAPWEQLEDDLGAYQKFLEETVGGIDTGDEDLLLGDPIGRDALMAELRYERLAYTPEELIALANVEFDWCDARRVEAAQAMGLGDDWRAAQEAVRALHVEPGQQPALINELAEEASQFLESRGLLRISPLAKETWRLGMMSPERQRFTPYFTGGEVISISYPTAGMDHDAKLQSMRGNNRHFSRATVHHELIPGHHLQGFMSDRWTPHRGMFYTPFLVEGWALYWELRLWDLDFANGPEDELGMLFWRAHRSARILFSLNFHLGNWTPEECVDFLVERVGHDRRNAEAEVRRSIQGGYGPLYQAAYLLGGMQLYALHQELVARGDWSEPDFHDAILRQNSIPPDLIRALLSGTELTRDLPIDWRFPGVAK